MSSIRFLRENENPTEADVRAMLSGHICRCTGYHAIVKAVLEVAAQGDSGGAGGSKEEKPTQDI